MITQYFDTSLKKWRRLFSGLGALLIVSFAFNISLGSVAIPLSSVIDFILLRPPIVDYKCKPYFVILWLGHSF